MSVVLRMQLFFVGNPALDIAIFLRKVPNSNVAFRDLMNISTAGIRSWLSPVLFKEELLADEFGDATIRAEIMSKITGLSRQCLPGFVVLYQSTTGAFCFSNDLQTRDSKLRQSQCLERGPDSVSNDGHRNPRYPKSQMYLGYNSSGAIVGKTVRMLHVVPRECGWYDGSC